MDCPEREIREINALSGKLYKAEQKAKKLKKIIEDVREIAWRRDIPHPTIPEYVELHQGMKEIMDYIDEHMEEKPNEKSKY